MYISTGLHDSQVWYWGPLNGFKLRTLKQIAYFCFEPIWMQVMEEHLEGLKPLRELAKEFSFFVRTNKSNSKNFVKFAMFRGFNKIHLDNYFL
jgi:hypothetical protein